MNKFKITILLTSLFALASLVYAFSFTTKDIAGDVEWTWGVDAGDINGDGFIDLAAANFTGSSKVWLNDGSANFTELVIPGLGIGAGINIVDIDKDNDGDILIGSVGTNSLRLFINDGNENFTQQIIYTGSGSIYEIYVADIDGDTDLDIYATDRDLGGITNLLYLNDGALNFTASHIPGDNQGSIVAKIIDIDGDNDLDIYAPSFTGAQNKLWINDGLGNGGASFTASDIPGDVNDAYFTDIVDIDGDSDLDIYVTGTVTQNKLWINDGLGNGGASFSASDIPGDIGASGGVIADIDQDGDFDIYVAEYTTQSNLWINDGLGNGGASFTDDPIPGDAFRTIGVRAADLDGDNVLDLYLAGYEGTQNKIWINNFVPPQVASVSTRTRSRRGGKSIRYACKDTQATNYSDTRFARHKQSMCEFDNLHLVNNNIENQKDTKNQLELGMQKEDKCIIPFTQYVQRGDSGSEVLAIQKFLNAYEFAGILEDSEYGNETHTAIKMFQTKYANEILKPWNLTTATGRWYQSTRKHANFLRGCPEDAVVLDNGITIN